MKMISNKLKKEFETYKMLLRSVPAITLTMLAISVIFMNLFGNRELYNSEYFCFNTGIVFSWIPFICLDCICKRFGTKAAIKINIFAVLINIIMVIIFYLLMNVPGTWAAVYSTQDPMIGQAINDALNSTFAGTWYVALGSAVSMLISGAVNSILNGNVSKLLHKDNYSGFAVPAIVSTLIGQWVDNFIFSSMVSHVFFGWNWTQVIICSTTSMILELLIEAISTPYGYHVSKKWAHNGVGDNYLRLVRGN